MRQTLKPLMLIFLLFLLSNGRIADVWALKAQEYSVNLFNDPRSYLSARQSCFPTSGILAANDYFDNLDEKNTDDIKRHDLARCPAQAESLTDLNSIDPASDNLNNFLLNITDSTNQTNSDQLEPSPEFNAQRLEEAERRKSEDAASLQQSQKTEANEDASAHEYKQDKPQTPPPIATFEEWTKEKLSSKEKKPPVKETQQQAGSGNGVPAVDQKPSASNGQASGVGSGAGQEQTVPTAPTAQPLPGTQDPNVQSSSILNDPSTQSNSIPASQMAKRNYASKECGAKVLLANDEAEHRNAVLNDKERDEYMRNPCERAQQKFLIIELCETIQPNFLELANFELFSSGPREIRLSVSERYPTAEWTPVGQFVAADTREMQSFHFNSPGIYAKFVKLDLLSHYGKEHYCTLTTVRLSGVSMVDEYEAEASNSMDSVAATIVAQPVEQQPTGTLNQPTEQHSVESQTPQKPIENEQKIDPSNESDKAKQENKPFMLNKMADIVGNLGQIKDAIGKTLLGNRSRQKMTGKIWPNSCANFCPLVDFDDQCPLRCHYLNIIDLPIKKSANEHVPTVQVSTTQKQTEAQRHFLAKIVRLSQCPTVVVEPKRVEPEFKSIEVLKPTEVPKEKPEQQEAVKIETKVEEQRSDPPAQSQASQQNQQFQLPKIPNSLPGTVSTHKESVFMKLNKRLSALELNMSLSSEYLSELSRRYVAQQDGYNKQHERDFKTLEEMVSRLGDNLKSGWIDEINQIRTDLKELAREMNHIKKTARHIPSGFDTASSSSLSVIDHSDRPYEDNCYNMLPPAEEDDLSGSDPNHSAWTNEQIVAVVTLSNLSIFTLFTCVYLLYKILARRTRINKELSADEIRALVQREIEQLRKSMPKETGQTHDIQINTGVQHTKGNNHVFTPSKRSKRKQRQANGLQSVASSTLSLPSTVATTSTSALDTMSSSQSLSDIDQQVDSNTAPLIMNLLTERSKLPEQERSASANLPVNLNGLSIRANSIGQQLSPPWQTVQAKRKLSDKSLKVPPVKNVTKMKVN